MNFTAIIAVLERKGIISRDEGEKLMEFLNNKPQSTMLNDAVEQIKDFIEEGPKALEAKLKAEAKKVASKAGDKAVAAAKQEVNKVADQAVETAKQEANTIAGQAGQEAVAAAEETAKNVVDNAASTAEKAASTTTEAKKS